LGTAKISCLDQINGRIKYIEEKLGDLNDKVAKKVEQVKYQVVLSLNDRLRKSIEL